MSGNTKEPRKKPHPALRGRGLLQAQRPIRHLVEALAIVVLICAVAVFMALAHERHIEDERREEVRVIAALYAGKLRSELEQALSASSALGAVVRLERGMPADPSAVAEVILGLYPGAAALHLAPDGVVSFIHPLEGNEAVLGLDLLNDPLRGPSARHARDSGRLSVSGPHELVQGGLGLIGRRAVHLTGEGGDALFWGFANVVIRVPDLLSRSGLGDIAGHGYAYTLSWLGDAAGQRILIASHGEPVKPVEDEIRLPNGRWVLFVSPIDGWGNSLVSGAIALGGLAFALLSASLYLLMRQQPHRLQRELLRRGRMLAAGERRYKTLYHSSQIATLTLAPAEGRISEANAAALALFGAERGARLIGLTPWDLSPETQPDGAPSAATAQAFISTAMREGKAHFHWLHRRLDGTTFPAEMRLVRIDLDGAAFLQATIQDRSAQLAAHRAQTRLGDFRALVAGIATDMLDKPLEELDGAIGSALAAVGDFFAADRAYVFHFSDDRRRMRNTHEWCAPGVEPQIDWLADYSTEALLADLEPLIQGRALVQATVAEMAEGPMRAFLQAQGINSVLAAPMVRAGQTIGFVGLDIVGWTRQFTAEDCDLLATFASLMANTEARRVNESELLRSRQRLTDIIWGTNVGTWEWNVRTGEMRFNERWAEMIGYRLDELAPLSIETWRRLLHPDDHAAASAALASHFAGHSDLYECEMRMRHRNGDWVWVLDRGRVVSRLADGQPEWMSGTLLDITARKEQEVRLRQSASVFEHASEGIMITRPDGTVVDVNEAFTRITGYSREEIIGKKPSILNSGRQTKSFYADMWRAIEQRGHWSGEIWNRRRSGEVFVETLTITAVRDSAHRVQHFIALFTDVTLQKEQQRKLEHIAHYDALTQLPNRVLLTDRLQQAMARTERTGGALAVVYVDLDGFKEINDTHGHGVGDQVLVAVASRLRKAMREGDSLARLGGDEFAVVFQDLPDRDASVPLLERLMSAVSNPVEVDHQSFRVSASAGVSVFPRADQIDADQLLREADQAMYQAKQSGKGRYHFFDAEHDRSVRGRHEALQRIREALVAGQFVLYYQPKVNMRTGEVLGVEALIRWRHPERGLLLPGAFLPLLEAHPLSIELGEWVLDSALAQIACWQAEGLSLPVSVNIDALHLQQDGFAAWLESRLAAYPALPPGSLELEILETSALEDMDHVSAVMEACNRLNVGFALDDFGTGYSSLSYLKRLPARQLKIDKSFVRDMLDDPEDLAILDGVMGLAVAFDREPLAEGVETVAHAEMLLRLGCDLGQGYAIARPMPAEAVAEWQRGWRARAPWSVPAMLEREDLPLLFVKAELRACVASLAELLGGGRSVRKPALTASKQRIDRWAARVPERHAPRPGADSIPHAFDSLRQRIDVLMEHLERADLVQATNHYERVVQLAERLSLDLDRYLDGEETRH